MALFNECMPQCAQKVFDTADIVRDGDISIAGPANKKEGTLEVEGIRHSFCIGTI